MAKLQNVKTIDMQDGLVTKIEYNGDVYEYFGEDNYGEQKSGDIVLNKDNRTDTVKGAYYQVNYYGKVYDDADELHTNIQRNCYAFRRANPEVALTNERLDSLEERVSVLEDEVESEQSPKHPFIGDLYGRKVLVYNGLYNGGDRRVGYGKIGQGLVNSGAIGTVTEHNYDGSVCVDIDRTTTTEKANFADAENYEEGRFYLDRGEYRVFGESEEDFEAGDKVKLHILKGDRPMYGWGEVSNGEIGKVEGVYDDRVRVNFPSQDYWTATPTELVIMKKSDKEVEEEDVEDEVKEETVDTEKTYVLVTGETHCGDIKEGDIAVLEDESLDSDGEVKIIPFTEDDTDWVKPENIVKLKKVDRPAKKGDIVVITESVLPYFLTKGKAYDVIDLSYREPIVYDNDGDDLSLHREHVVFEKVVEFEEGDIVRVNGSQWFPDGSLGVVDLEETDDGQAPMIHSVHEKGRVLSLYIQPEHLELVAKKGDRQDV